MGTRAKTYIYENDKPVLCIYRQYDGYPRGHGAELHEFLDKLKLVNGFAPGDENKLGAIANGVGCLAAQLVREFKDSVGGIYIKPIDTDDHHYIDYIYKLQFKVNWDKHGFLLDQEFNLTIQVFVGDHEEPIFTGGLDDFQIFCEIPMEDE